MTNCLVTTQTWLLSLIQRWWHDVYFIYSWPYNITTTQIYAMTSNKLGPHIKLGALESRIKGHLPVMGGMVIVAIRSPWTEMQYFHSGPTWRIPG